VYLPKSVAELNAAFDQIAADLAQQYVLSYYPAADHRDGRFHAIELRVKSRKDVRIRSRRGYYSPKPARLQSNDF
jgi:VWFA-related protein